MARRLAVGGLLGPACRAGIGGLARCGGLPIRLAAEQQSVEGRGHHGEHRPLLAVDPNLLMPQRSLEFPQQGPSGAPACLQAVAGTLFTPTPDAGAHRADAEEPTVAAVAVACRRPHADQRPRLCEGLWGTFQNAAQPCCALPEPSVFVDVRGGHVGAAAGQHGDLGQGVGRRPSEQFRHHPLQGAVAAFDNEQIVFGQVWQILFAQRQGRALELQPWPAEAGSGIG